MFTFSTYAFLVFLHVGSAVVLVGQSIGSLLVRTMIRDARSVSALREWLRYSRASARWNPAAALLLLATGVYLGSSGWWNAAWFQVAIAAWAVNAVLAAQVVKPAAGALGAAAARLADGPIPAEIRSLISAGEGAARAMLANDVAMLYIMVAKTTLVESLAAVCLAQATLAAVAAWRSTGTARTGVEASRPA